MMTVSRPAESTATPIDPGSFDPETRSRSHWVIVFNPQPRPRMRLVCFPYAGGDANIFRDWAVATPAGVEVIGVQYPGRGCNDYLPSISNCDEMVSQLRAELAPFLGIEFAFFGHSNGALISFEVARSLSAETKSRMRHLFLSAKSAPHVLDNRYKISGLDDENFVRAIREIGGTPSEVLNDAWLVKRLLPRLRADFALGETYVYRPSAPLECAVSILQGEYDDSVDSESANRWSELTTGRVRQCSIESGHFFLHTHKAQVLALVRAVLLECAS
jgi:medium-chain acyl-[acyl-carrier-protein] hydrolase